MKQHLADILKMTVKGQTKVNLEITGSEEPLSKIDAMVNNHHGDYLCRASDRFQPDLYNGYVREAVRHPGAGAIGFLIAAILGLRLVYDILKKK